MFACVWQWPNHLCHLPLLPQVICREKDLKQSSQDMNWWDAGKQQLYLLEYNSSPGEGRILASQGLVPPASTKASLLFPLVPPT